MIPTSVQIQSVDQISFLQCFYPFRILYFIGIFLQKKKQEKAWDGSKTWSSEYFGRTVGAGSSLMLFCSCNNSQLGTITNRDFTNSKCVLGSVGLHWRVSNGRTSWKRSWWQWYVKWKIWGWRFRRGGFISDTVCWEKKEMNRAVGRKDKTYLNVFEIGRELSCYPRHHHHQYSCQLSTKLTFQKTLW